MTMKKRKSNVRNPFYNHPLMRKGDVHEKSNKAKRKSEKQKFQKEWCCLSVMKQVFLNNSTHCGIVA